MQNELLEKEKSEKELLEKIERLEKERSEREKLDKIRLEKERLMKERLEKESSEREKIEKERKEKERLMKEEIEKESSERKKLQNEILERDTFEKELLERMEILENEFAEKERLEKERLEKEKREKERLEKERFKKELMEKEKIEKEKKEKERIKKERIEQEKKEQEKLKKDLLKKEAEELERKKKEITELKKRFEKIKNSISNYINNIKEQENFCDNFKLFINEFNMDINDINSKIHISIVGLDNDDNDILNILKKGQIFQDIGSTSKKFNEFYSIIENIKNNKIKKIESRYNNIQQLFNNIDISIKNNSANLKVELTLNNGLIKNQIEELEHFEEELKNDQSNYEKLRKELEKKIEILQDNGKEFFEEAENIKNSILKSGGDESKRINKNKEKKKDTNKNNKNDKNNKKKKDANNKNKNDKNNEKKIDTNNNYNKINYRTINKVFLKNSMLLGIDEFSNPNDIFNSKMLFNSKVYSYQQKDLLRRNYKETCYIYEDYDLYDTTFELRAIGLDSYTFYNSTSIGFTVGRLIKILEFEIDGKKADYVYNDSLLEFDIHLGNFESNQIHVKYKEYPNLTENEKKERKLYRSDWYGLSKNLRGQKAIFTLIIKCDYEVINFEKEQLAKVKEGEYKWGGEVPYDGKKFILKMSRKSASFKFDITERIESLNGKPIKNTTLTVGSLFKGGNNIINNMVYYSNQTDKVKFNKDERKYEVNFNNTNSSFGEFILKGDLVNRCKGEWKCDLTDEEIEKHIPDDYKYNKEKFKEIALNIISNYDKKHEKNVIKVTDFVKVGEWVKENIKYDLRYIGRNEISATQVYNNGAGVCHHFTKLYNAFLYSLGYQCIYISGYAIKNKDYFDKDDGHAWSLIKVNGKWLPFDATWGIFSGKLTVGHVFEDYFSRSLHVIGTDGVRFGERKINGKFLQANPII